MEPFVQKGSIVRRIWGSADTALLVFAGSSAEFALNKAVDWLYFTGALPADPLGRLFSTVAYAQKIVFAGMGDAHTAIDSITAIHRGVEKGRGYSIPDEAYLDVLFMLIDYSIRGFELLERRLTGAEKEEVFHVFQRVGVRMGLKSLPVDYVEWRVRREQYLSENLVYSHFSKDLYCRYRKSLGGFRYRLLLQFQALLLPERVQHLLSLPPAPLLPPLVKLYKGCRSMGLDRGIKALLLPRAYRSQIARLDIAEE